MADQLKVYVAQTNPTLGAIEANCAHIAEIYGQAMADGADLVLTPEFSVCGYPPEDLVQKPFFQRTAKQAVEALAEITEGEDSPGLIVGFPWVENGKLYNAVGLLADGEIKELRFKIELPNYGVFDEKRVFDAGPETSPIEFRGIKLGVMICEDMWFPTVAKTLKDKGAELFLVPNGSPFEMSKHDWRMEQAVARVNEHGLSFVYCNQLGGQDELVFEGASFALNRKAEAIVHLKAWEEDATTLVFQKDVTSDGFDLITEYGDTPAEGLESLYNATVLALRDYVTKNRFPGVVLGLSGGVDSAICAAIAVDALGADRVHCVMMPSRYTSDESLDDAKQCAEMMGVRYDIVPIAPAVGAFGEMLGSMFAGQAEDTTEENIQSRIRGVTLMAISNKFGGMVVTTGNKSEVSVGYSTLYGDMCGGFNPLKDIYKTDVFALCHWRNENMPVGAMGPNGRVIPENIITKPPTAELRPDQKDEDSLPPYDRLDAILRGLVDEDKAVSELVSEGYDEAEVARVEHLLYIAEYKRRQAAPGVKTTAKLFGRDRRYPITNGFRSARRPNK